MPDVSDIDLLQDYARAGSETAFAELVRRHINLVYSAAMRQVGNAAQAEEITQAVFIILARKAEGLRSNIVLEGWLYETTRLTSLSFLRGERRRQFREQEAYMQSTLHEGDEDAVWNDFAPLLDEAMSKLNARDRDAVILRFFKEKSVHEVAAALNVNEGAAQRRVLRAMEKLRRFFAKNGVSSTTAIIGEKISAHSVQAAPAALAKSVVALAFAKGAAASVSTTTLIKGAMKLMTWTKMKSAALVGAGMLLVAGTAVLVAKETPSQTDLTAFQGTWSGQEMGAPGTSTLVMKDSNLEFRGANPMEWYKATVQLHEDTSPKQCVVTITDCPVPQFVGKTSTSIYKIEGNTLTMCGYEPGNPNVPPGFAAHGTRTLKFTRK